MAFEPLEDRRLLALYTVTNLNDSGVGSLRGAIGLANANPGADDIDFLSSLSGGTIALSGELQVTEALSIDAGPLTDNITLNANQQSRIFNITAAAGNFRLAGLTMTAGRTAGDLSAGSGGAIRSLSAGELYLEDSVVSGSRTTGEFAVGGGIFANGAVRLVRTTISGNRVSDDDSVAPGGGVFAGGNLSLFQSTVSDNSTAGEFSHGGGLVSSGDMTIDQSTVSGNRTTGDESRGGGVFATRKLTVIDSVISNNRTGGLFAYGGGIFASGDTTFTRSTVSGNATTGFGSDGAGMYIRGTVELNHSVVEGNSGLEGADGGGIFADSVTLNQSAVINNTTNGSGSDGGGIIAIREGDVTLVQSIVSGNRTLGGQSPGGGIWADGDVMLIESTVSGNSTSGNASRGGGIVSLGTVTVDRSTVSGNQTTGASSGGGGINAAAVVVQRGTVSGNKTFGTTSSGGGIGTAKLTVLQGTISGNATYGENSNGGGAFARRATVTQSTVTLNWTDHGNSSGGGIFQGNFGENFPFDVTGSIIAANASAGGGADLVRDPGNVLTVNYSLIGTQAATDAGGNNVFSDNPQLGPLGNYGGATLTHALLGGPAIDAGDPSFSAASDQRGAPFGRIFDGDGANGARADMGAYERQKLSPALFVVTTTADELNYANGAVSLREAINSANGSVDPDVISFAPGLSGQTITLGGQEMEITEAVTIDATALAAGVTVNGNLRSRIFNITATAGDFRFAGLTLSGGRTTGHAAPGDDSFSGGAVRSLTTGNLTFDRTTLAGNSTTGNRARGGAVFAVRNVTLESSTVSGNSTTGVGAHGGGVAALGLAIARSSNVSGNTTAGDFAYGGGIYSLGGGRLTRSTLSGNSTLGTGARGGGMWTYGYTRVHLSTVSGNSTTGNQARGGGIYAAGPSALVTIEQSTVSGNMTTGSGPVNGPYSEGGGIAARGDVWLLNSTLSGNRTTGAKSHGGGIWSSGRFVFGVAITQSTVTDNHVASGEGGGVYQVNLPLVNFDIAINGSIVAGNTASGGGADVVKDAQSTLTVTYSLIGTGVTPSNAGGNNVAANNPQLAPLANNGGPTQSRAPLPGSQAIDRGDPSIAFNPAESDQRGAPFVRVYDGDGVGGARIDIGAHELQPPPSLHFVVDIAADEDDGNTSAGDLSLREAIGLANATSSVDLITFAPSLAGQTVTLGGVELAIAHPLTIDATALVAPVTINANQLSRVFNITPLAGDFTFARLTIVGGRTTANTTGRGGAIRSNSAGTLTLNRSTVSGSGTTGEFAFGGGIYARGAVTLVDSTVSGNSTTADYSSGGGVSAGGAATLTRSTVSGNSTAGISSGGGGISASGAVTLLLSTVSGNSTTGSSSQGGGIRAGGALAITQSTITANSVNGTAGGLFQADSVGNAPFVIHSSIVAGNLSPFARDVVKDPQSALTINYSLIGAADGLTFTGIANFTGTSTNPLNPQLGPLTDNGGPTRTHAPLVTSPVIDHGDLSLVVNPTQFDQRGAPFVRVYDGNGTFEPQADMGAVEYQFIALPSQGLVVDTASDVFDGNVGVGQLSLREAVALANGVVGPDVITFAPALAGQTILLTGFDLRLREALTVDATALGQNVLINGSNQFNRVFTIVPMTGDFAFRGLTITGGRTVANDSGRGGGIRSNTTGMLTLDRSTVSGNSTTGEFAFGGGVYARGAVTLLESTVSGNSTSGYASSGGGIFAGGAVTLTRSTVSGNSTAGISAGGGGIAASGAVTLTLSTISGNSAPGSSARGGAIRAGSDVTLSQSTIVNNHAPGGGGVYQAFSPANAPFVITGSIVAGNTAFNAAAGIDLVKNSHASSTLTVNYSLIGVADGLTLGGVGNQTGTAASPLNPQLGPLAANGGPTFTHLPLAVSPVVNAGDPDVAFSLLEYDGRGAPFVRVSGGRIDAGAVELHAAADFDTDSDVDGFDFLAWQRGFGASGAAATKANGNADGDSDVDAVDFGLWRAQFGDPPGASANLVVDGDDAAAVDAVFARGDFAGLLALAEEFVPAKRRRLVRR